MKRLLAFCIAVCVASTAAGETFYNAATTFARPHPAVVRVAAPERDGTSYGSGALVAVNESSGLVLTNWHVVRDAADKIVVYFPDGFRSGAFLLRTNRDWDLAALAIRRPNVEPIPIAVEAPRPGEQLTIAGYGSGSYRAVSGRLTQYVSPGGDQPFEMIEMSAPARNGDSGGPILNSRGELTGTLFGSAFGRTTGSYCGRLRWFLNSVDVDFRRISAQAMLAQQSRQTSSPLPTNLRSVPGEGSGVRAVESAISPLNNGQGVRAAEPAISPLHDGPEVKTAENVVSLASLPEAQPSSPAVATTPVSLASAKSPSVPTASIPAPPAGLVPNSDKLKSILALIGALSILYCSVRFLGWAVG